MDPRELSLVLGKWVVVVGVLAVLAGRPAFALDPDKGLSACTVQVWHVRDGLPGAWVRALAQTPDGYLWIATANGLARHDGATIEAVPTDGSLSRLWDGPATLPTPDEIAEPDRWIKRVLV